jgi:hypothetical protein
METVTVVVKFRLFQCCSDLNSNVRCLKYLFRKAGTKASMQKLKYALADQERRGIKFNGLQLQREVQLHRVREISLGNPRESAGMSGLKNRLQSLLLPEGYPTSVTPGYLSYQLWNMPTHITVYHVSSQPSFTSSTYLT